MVTHTYTLPDLQVLHSERQADFSVWQPGESYIVLGRSNRVTENAVYMDKARDDGIKILKRPSGGEAVVLTPNMLIISVKLPVRDSLKTHWYFEHVNQAIKNALALAGIRDVNPKGISDLAIGVKKILGSSIYRKEGTVFYHAVLNVSETVSTISRYLKHPSREPDYRHGRDHKAFVTSLREEGYDISAGKLLPVLRDAIKELISNCS